MAAMITTTVPLDITVYDQMAGEIAPHLKAASGFRSHACHAIDGGFVVTEVWDSAQHHRDFFEANVKPNLPPDGVTVDVVELRNTIEA